MHSYLPKTDDGRGKWDRTKTAEQRLIDRVTKKQAEPGQIIGFTGKLTGKLSDKLHQLKSLEKDKDEYQVVTLLDVWISVLNFAKQSKSVIALSTIIYRMMMMTN